jgi:hypothetical protein
VPGPALGELREGRRPGRGQPIKSADFIPIKLSVIIGNTMPPSGLVTTGGAFFPAVMAMSIFGIFVNRNCLPVREKMSQR